MKTIVLTLTNPEAKAMARARLTIGYGVQESKALHSAQAKLDAALSKGGNAFGEVTKAVGDVLELFDDRADLPAAVRRLIQAMEAL